MRTSDQGVSLRPPFYTYAQTRNLAPLSTEVQPLNCSNTDSTCGAVNLMGAWPPMNSNYSATPTLPIMAQLSLAPGHLGRLDKASTPGPPAGLWCASPSWSTSQELEYVCTLGQGQNDPAAPAYLTDGEDAGLMLSHPVTSRRCGRKCRRHMRLHAGDPLSISCRSFGSSPLAPCFSPRHS